MSDENKSEKNEKAAEKEKKPKRQLPELPEIATDALEAFSLLDSAERAIFMLHAAEMIRADGVKASQLQASSEEEPQLAVGDRVRITGGSARHIGADGILTKVRRVRCFVAIDGLEKDVYLFRSDVAPLIVANEETNEDEAKSA